MDPRAVPMIWSVFVRGGERMQLAAVQMLAQIDGPSASNGLAVLAVFSSSAEVRSRAIGTLNRRDPRDVVGRLIGLIHKPYKYQMRHVNGPGSPGELFVEGERFNLHRFYQNVNKTPNIYLGRLYTPDIPFDPYSIQNLVLATIPSFVPNPSLAQVPGANLGNPFATYPLPISPQSAALAAKAMAANPQSAPAILGQLINNPENRYAPSGYWFYPNQPNGIAANRPVTQPSMQQGPASPANMAAMTRLVEAANRAAINQMAMNQQSLNNPQHQAGPVHRQETGSANAQSGIALGMMDTGQTLAAQRDLQIAQELEGLRQANLELERRLAMDVQFVETTNDGINLCNDRTLPVLQSITGQDLGAAPEKWKSWWTDQLGYVYQTESPENKPTYTDVVNNRVVRSSCFAAGTLVQTIDGERPIETIRVGDRVLSQGTSTGQLSFQPVVATHRSQPTETLRIAITGESIVATGIHRFWRAGKGWVMARELKAGDSLRMVGGTVTVSAIEPDQAQVVYNLDVAINRDFFVGRSALLVHDYSFVQPVLEPFDRQPELTSQASVSK
jgi:Pretoxin HINT domain